MIQLKCISDDGKGVMDSKVMLNAMVKAKEKGINNNMSC